MPINYPKYKMNSFLKRTVISLVLILGFQTLNAFTLRLDAEWLQGVYTNFSSVIREYVFIPNEDDKQVLNVNTCANQGPGPDQDFDCDGVINRLDIDDDNDGVLDHIESPNCFFSSVDWNTSNKSDFVSISSELLTIAANSNYAGLTDGIDATAAVQFVTATAQSQLNKELFKMEFFIPVQLDAFYIKKTSSTQIFATTASSLMVQGSNDDVNWTNLLPAAIASPGNATNVTANGAVSLTNSNKFEILANAAAYKYYRIFGVLSANILGGIASEFYFDVNNQTYQASLYPKAVCTDDADGDGFFNHMDLDSDGDGCSDALEGGATTSQVANFQFTGPFGANGLDNSLETAVDSGIINYTLTYSPFAISRNLAICVDTDGDGILDSNDIDDDNDGILDAVESPNCFQSANDWNTSDKSFFATVSSDLMTITANSNFGALTDNLGLTNAAVQFSTSPAQNQLNQELFKVTLSRPTQLDAIYIQKTSSTQIFATTASSLMVQGSNDDVNWTNLLPAAITSPGNATNVTANGAVSLTNSNKFDILTNAAAYKYYRIFGVLSANILGGIASEFYFDVNNQTYQASLYPKAVCTNDVDGDGLFNHMDLDSDGDGCSDALEGGATTSQVANFQFTGPFGDNGLDNSLETAVDSGIINYTLTYTPFAISRNLAICLDTDGDGIFDIYDIDDDNDGILDAVESPNCFQSATDWNTSDKSFFATVSSDLMTITANSNFGALTDNLGLTNAAVQFSTSPAQNQLNQELFKVTLSRPTQLDAIYIQKTSSTQIFATTASSLMVQGSNDDVNWTNLLPAAIASPVNATNVTANGAVSLTNSNKFEILANAAAYKYYRIFGLVSANILGGIASEFYFDVNNQTYQASYYPKPVCNEDVDRDGLFNHLDLDSDGDGCNDASEAGVISFNVQVPLTGDFGANGFLNSLETAVDSGVPSFNYTYRLAIEPKIKACVDTDGDGIPDVYDLDDDNDGILDFVECETADTLFPDNWVFKGVATYLSDN
jgi:hypothetical protein